MHIWAVDDVLLVVGDSVRLLLLIVLLKRRLFRVFPAFFCYVSWDLISDIFLYSILLVNRGYFSQHYAVVYYSASIVTFLLEIAVLLEIAADVFRPAAVVFTRRMIGSFAVFMVAVGYSSYFLAKLVNPAPFFKIRVFLLMDTSAALLCVVTFLLIAGFSQVLGLSWKNHVLQIATGLAFFSFADLAVELIQSQLHAGPSYASRFQFWSRFTVIGYLGTVFFWCYAFLKQEAPRKEFSPQMQKILVQLSGSAKRQTAVLARSREP